jgi:hypothetical protein
MASTAVDLLMGRVASQSPMAVAIWEGTDGQKHCQWVNLDPEEVVTLLYDMADQVMRLKVPAKPVRHPN